MRKNADVICQHTKDGRTIPLKIRIEDEDGELQSYNIRSYRQLSVGGSLLLPNEVNVAKTIWRYECKVCIWGRERIVELFYHLHENVWYVELK